MISNKRATVQDLYDVPENGKADIVKGELIRMSPRGGLSGRATTKIAASLTRHEEEHGGGYAFGDNVGFLVDLPDRDSFSPDAAWYVRDIVRTEPRTDARFLAGAKRLGRDLCRLTTIVAPGHKSCSRERRTTYYRISFLICLAYTLLILLGSKYPSYPP